MISDKNRTRTLSQWLQELIRQRGVASPDGRPLYAYKLSDLEFSDLKALLIQVCSTRQWANPPVYISQAWLLYAAEWWKRSYEGGAWAWAPVFASLGVNTPEYVRIQSLVEYASKAWGLTQKIQGGKKYIGLVAINGGLPLRLIETEQGNLAKLLKTSLKHAIRYSLQPSQIRDEIEAHRELLPISYRQSVVFELLTSIVEKLKSFREIYSLHDVKDPIAVLSAAYGDRDWMDEFPLRVDGTAAKQLLNGLITTAARVSTATTRYPFIIHRKLRFSSDGTAKLEMSFEMSPSTSCDTLAKVFDCNQDKLPPTFQLLLSIDGHEELVGEGVLRHEVYRLVAKRIVIPHERALSPVQLLLSQYGSTVCHTNLPGGEQLDDDSPWVLEDNIPSARFLRSGSVRLRQPSALLLVPEKAIVFAEQGNAELLPSPHEGKKLLRLHSGSTRITYQKQSYHVVCGTNQATEESVFWRGEMLDFESTLPIYLGPPYLLRSLPSGEFIPVPSAEVICQSGEGKMSLANGQTPFGPVTLTWVNGKDVLSRHRAYCLPKDAKINFESSPNPLEGIIWLKKWPCTAITTLTPGVTLHAVRVGEDWRLNILSLSPTAPESVHLLILWKSVEQQLTLPFPGQGVIFLDNLKEPIPRNGWIAMEQLDGARLRLLPNQRGAPWRLRLSLHGDAGSNTKDVVQEINYGDVREIRLFELRDAVGRMLSLTSLLDVWVTIEAIEGYSSRGSIQVGRYTFELRRLAGIVTLNRDGQTISPRSKATEIQALPIQYPEMSPLTLPVVAIDGTEGWGTESTKSKAGTWLIYPSAFLSISARPLALWTRDGCPNQALQDQQEGLRAALGLDNQELRLAAIYTELDRLSREPFHPDWEFAAALLQKLGHLPLSSLDFWVALAKHPKAMVMAYLQIDGFAENFGVRVTNELPFEWYLTSPMDWTDCVSAIRNHYVASGDSRGERILRRDLEYKRDILLTLQPGLMPATQLAGHSGLGDMDRQVTLLTQHADVIMEPWLKRLFVGADSDLQAFFRRAAVSNDVFIPSLPKQLQHFIDFEARRLLKLLPLPPDDQKITSVVLPLYVAKCVAMGKAKSWLTDINMLHALRKSRTIDPIWFDAAYEVGIAHAIGLGELKS